MTASMSTPASAYRSLKRGTEADARAGGGDSSGNEAGCAGAFQRDPLAALKGLAVNDFEGPVFKRHPENRAD